MPRRLQQLTLQPCGERCIRERRVIEGMNPLNRGRQVGIDRIGAQIHDGNDDVTMFRLDGTILATSSEAVQPLSRLPPDSVMVAHAKIADQGLFVARSAVTGIERSITSSFGVAVLPEDAPEAQALLRAADRALYQAKANGRDRVELAAV